MTNINRRQCHRIVPMEVMCFGLSRTGTLSLREALITLGYHSTYHYRSCAIENPRDCEMWIDAFKAKFEHNGTFGKEQWDQLLGHCVAITDSPAVFFWEELLKAYPNTKIVLTVRDSPEKYYQSFMRTLWPFGLRFCIPTWNPYRLYYRALLPESSFGEMNYLLYKHGHGFNFPVDGKRRYLEHNERIRQTIPKERLLEYNVKQGWAPLCEFLGKGVPEDEFPNCNDADTFDKTWAPVLQTLDGIVARKLIVGIAMTVGLGVIWLAWVMRSTGWSSHPIPYGSI